MTKAEAWRVMHGLAHGHYLPLDEYPRDIMPAAKVAADALKRSMKATRAAKRSAIAKRKSRTEGER